ncbi:MAG TPA: transcriptional regulator, partial [Actinoplanes sp.]|nr:transcriptional regulator [Actinoplanes sp.]
MAARPEAAAQARLLTGTAPGRDRVVQVLFERGSATAAELGAELGLSPAAIRKH